MMQSFVAALALFASANVASAAGPKLAPLRLPPAVRQAILKNAKADPSWSAWVSPGLKVESAVTTNKSTYKYKVAITARMSGGPVKNPTGLNFVRMEVATASFKAVFPGAAVTRQGKWKMLPLPMFAINAP